MVGSMQASRHEDAALERLRYPIGRLRVEPHPTPEQHKRWIARIAALPGELRLLVQDLADRQLDTPYRAGGWTIRQVARRSHASAES